MTGRFIFGIVNFRAKEIEGSIQGVLFFWWYIYKVSRCQGVKPISCPGCGVGLVKIRAKDQRKGKDQTKGTYI